MVKDSLAKVPAQPADAPLAFTQGSAPLAHTQGVSLPNPSSGFEALARRRGVDLAAETRRVNQQLSSGQTIRGTTQSSQRGIAAAQAAAPVSAPAPSFTQQGFSTSGLPGEFQGQVGGIEGTGTGFGQGASALAPSAPIGSPTNPNPDGSFQYTNAAGKVIAVDALGNQEELGIFGLDDAERARLRQAAAGGLIATSIGAAILQFLGTTAVSKVALVGTTALSTSKASGIGSAGAYATNTVTQASTMSMMTGLGYSMAAAGGAMTVVGTYPFAGFIKEEALQTLSFAQSTALKNGDLEGAQRALDFTNEILDPERAARLVSKIPFVNVQNELKDFFQAAKIHAEINQKVIDDTRMKIETGMTDADIWARRQEEKNQDFRDNTDYHNEQARIAFDYENEAIQESQRAANEAERKLWEDSAAFWAAERAKQRELEAEDRIAIAEFWLEYRKAAAKQAENSRPSKLNFGIL